MPLLRKIIINITLFLCISHVNSKESEVRHVTKYWTFAEESMVNGKILDTKDDTFVYILRQYTEPAFNVTYNINMESWPFKDGVVRDICNITFTTKDEDRIFVDYLNDFFPISQSKVLLYFSDMLKNESSDFRNQLKVYYVIVSIENCTTSNVTFFSENNKILTSPVIYNNSFEFALSNKPLCGDFHQCLITYDFKGKQIRKPKPYDVNVGGWLYSVDSSSSNKGYFLSTYDFDKMMNGSQSPAEEYIIYPEGKYKKLVTARPIFLRTYSIGQISNAHKFHSICWRLNPKVYENQFGYSTTIRCMQTDTKTIKLKITLEFPNFVNWIAVHNLAKGGMFVATGFCSHEFSSGCREIQILKIHPDGKKDRMLTVGGFQLKCPDVENLKVKIMENENEYCFIFVCEYTLYKYRTLGYHKTCVKKNHISFPYEI